MSDSYSPALGLSRLLLTILRVFNLIAGMLLAACLIGSFLFEPAFRDFFTQRPPSVGSWVLMPVLRIWLLLAAPAILAMHVSLTRLLELVETVRTGDPFSPANAVRLKTIAWCVLGLQLFQLLCGLMAATMNAAGSNIDWSFSTSGWLAVLLLFVLARVFEEGTRIRNDLEAMV